MVIQTIKTDSVITLVIDGRVDTNTCGQLQSAILEGFQTSNDLVVDFTAVGYISSAGLRALLIGQKTANSKKGSFKIIGVSPAVMNIFVTVGFSDVMTIIPA